MAEAVEVFVALRNEGTSVWRPVTAERIAADVFHLVGRCSEDESWEFPPGSVVRCNERTFEDGRRGIVAVGFAGSPSHD